MTAYKCIASEARPCEDTRFLSLAPCKQRLREEKVLYYHLVCTTVRTSQLRSINPPDTVSCMYYGTNYATTVNQSTGYSFSYVLRYYATTLYLSTRKSFLYMYYGTMQLRSTYPRELVSCIGTTVLRNYALPIHEN